MQAKCNHSFKCVVIYDRKTKKPTGEMCADCKKEVTK